MVFSFVMAFVMGGRMAWIFLVTLPLLSIGLALVISRTIPLFRKVFRKYDKLNESIQENIKAMRVVKSFVREDYEQRKFNAAAEDVCRDFTRAERILAFNGPMMQFCIYATMVFVLSFGSYTIITSRGLDLDVGQFSSLLTYNFMMLNSLMMLSMIFVMIVISMESCKRIVEVLTEESTLHDPANPVREVADGSIDFDNVSFKYNANAERMALSNIDLHIASGETIGIIGGTGSSKSSLIQLISRLYDATEGTVKVGGLDVRSYSLESLRNQVSVVLQKNVLFSGTIKDNLRWGDKEATDEEMVRACQMACADEFISQFPDGYDTWIEQGGTNVSGGQKQRLCIARALLKKPKILILDDSTSAVDTRTDAKIRRALRDYIPSTTKIIIAQRVSSVQDADRIVVMDGAPSTPWAPIRSSCGATPSIRKSTTLKTKGATAMRNNQAKIGTVGRILRTVRQFYPVLLPVTVACILFNAVVSSIPSIFMQNVIALVEQNWQNGDWSVVGPQILSLVALLATFYGLSLVASLAFNQLMAIITQGTLKKLRQKLFGGMQRLPIKYFDQNDHGDIMSHYTNDIDTCGR